MRESRCMSLLPGTTLHSDSEQITPNEKYRRTLSSSQNIKLSSMLLITAGSSNYTLEGKFTEKTYSSTAKVPLKQLMSLVLRKEVANTSDFLFSLYYACIFLKQCQHKSFSSWRDLETFSREITGPMILSFLLL
jgi:hypothetical protein